MLVGVADLVGIGVVPSYMALRRQRLAGVFPEPKTLPSRLLAWEARQIVDWYDNLEKSDDPYDRRNRQPSDLTNQKPASKKSVLQSADR
jgi:predicted DNA-binding transcriptional regulator AlpA